MSTIHLPHDDIAVQDLKRVNNRHTAIPPLTQSAPGNTVNSNTRQATHPSPFKRKTERRKEEDRRQLDRRQQRNPVFLDTRNHRERRRGNRRKEKFDLKNTIKNVNSKTRGIDITI
ncbi:MAG: hypothetical protein GXP08_01750 [Gammaproteobacteria bacterium]|nr:hypothetical protein [Gammaproteobacteria bacterium]